MIRQDIVHNISNGRGEHKGNSSAPYASVNNTAILILFKIQGISFWPPYFLYGPPLFGYLSQRSLTHSNRDSQNYYAPKKMVELYHRDHSRQNLPAHPGQLAAETRSLGVDYFVVKKPASVNQPFPVVFNTNALYYLSAARKTMKPVRRRKEKVPD